ncbi:MAG: hypothetical protein V1820_02710 [archaeon]
MADPKNVYYYEPNSIENNRADLVEHRVKIFQGQAEPFEDPMDHLIWKALSNNLLGLAPRVKPLQETLESPGYPFLADTFVMCDTFASAIESGNDGTKAKADAVAGTTLAFAEYNTKEEGELIIAEKINPLVLRLAAGADWDATRLAYSEILERHGYNVLSCNTYSFTPEGGLSLEKDGSIFPREGPDRYVLLRAEKLAAPVGEESG